MTIAALTILGPLAAAALILVLRRVAPALAVAGTGVSLAGALLTLVRVAGGARYEAVLPGLPEMPLRLVVEPLTAVLAALVAVVSFFVMVYAVGYTTGEGGKVRFFSVMSLFAAAMQTLVIAGDWVLLLAAWEVIGFASFLLIGFDFERAGVGRAALRAFLYTRSADLGLYVAIFVLISRTGTSEVSATLGAGGAAAVAAGLLLLLAAMGKSAQTPFHGWLLDAMAGPTPVSALLHSATLVAAGAVLLIRAFPLLPPTVLVVAGVAGGLTALVTGLTALAQRDLKRLLAASTASQYGLMLLAVGAGSPVAALFHLLAHAATKSSLFLGAGVFQHAAAGSTDLADLEGVGRAHRRVFLAFVVAGLALVGVPPLSGFFSKDAILAASFASPAAWILAPLALAGTLLTGLYVARALRLLWRGTEEAGSVAGIGWMGAGLAVLAALSATLGLALPLVADLLGAPAPEETLLVGAAGLVAALVGLALGWRIPGFRLLGPLLGPSERGFRTGGGFDGLVARPALSAARALDLFDRGVHAVVFGVARAGLALASASRVADERGLDGVIRALVRGARSLGGRARRLQSGLVHRELLLAAAGGALILVFLAVGVIGL
ncbi:NADH-quinone oxidoreductase subunit L (plasmid) [Rubrobacter marinus]|uniref:NADH-quinone oxidoreductase subunit L n=1 Tax=Rubrobacter marinus TaxID=2653852 RepID=A0A6G8Q3C8_9ACTN|nr:proton-conducting transporter membrane subunit [Rubrobacter marinus]QIN81004.1 NADH-quinone oxidoreductase subunit L [Rubrobacter marinus]